MRKSLKVSLALSLALTGSLYAVEVTIDPTTTKTDFEAKMKQDGEFVYIKDTSSPNNNTLIWNGTPSNITAKIYLTTMKSSNSSVSKNTLNFNGDNTNSIDKIYGASTDSGNATENTLNINSGNLEEASIVGGVSSNGSVINNTVNINGGNLGRASIAGGYSNKGGSAINNTVNINDGNLGGAFIYGGEGFNKGSAINNTVNINDGNLGGAFIYGGYSEKGSATNNTVNINGGNLEGTSIVGGGFSDDGSANLATHNTVNLNADALKLKDIYGGYNTTGDKFTGNTLNVRGKNITANAIHDFEFLNFYIPIGFRPAIDKMLILTEAPDLAKSKIGVGMINGGVLNNGDKLILIEAINDIKYPTDMANKTGQLQAGISAAYTFTLEKDTSNKKLLAVVRSNNSGSGSKTLLAYPKNILETSAGELGVLSSGSDLVSSMSLSTDSNGAFGSTSASNTRLKSGSHVDIKSFNAAVGLGKEFEGNQVGTFIEFGGGKYDSFNDFGKIDVRGNGKFKYIGLGVATKFSLPNSFYLSSSFKAGKINSDYESDIPAITTPKYEATRSYYGAHLGLGKIIDLNDVSNIDIYSKVLFNKLGKKEIEVVGDRILLKSTISLSAKFGARYSYIINEKLDLYTGASYEREFKGEAKGYNITHDADITSPSIKGSTYNAEIGAKLNTTDSLKLDFNLQGMTGKKRGVNGGVGVEWRF